MLKQMAETVRRWRAELAEDGRRDLAGEEHVAFSTGLRVVLSLSFFAEMALLWALLVRYGDPAIVIVLLVTGVHVWYARWSSRAVKAFLLATALTAALFVLAISAFDAGHCLSVIPGSDLHCEFGIQVKN
jgi:hypothetical protein